MPAAERAIGRRSGALSTPRALGLGQFAQDERALERRQVIGEQDAVEMIHLVLQTARQQPVGIDLPLQALAVEVAYADLACAGDFPKLLRQAETALLGDVARFGAPDQLWVDDEERCPRALLAEIGDQDPLEDPDLRCRQADARRRVHRL